jgi:hypothetical protein
MRSDHLASSGSLGLAKQRYNQPPLDDDFDDMDMAIGVVDVDEEEGIAREHDCPAPHSTIGRAGCGARITIDDAFVSPLHAELHQTPKGWRIENRGLNGLWVRIDAPIKLGGPSQFQCGEQRFVFVPLAD